VAADDRPLADQLVELLLAGPAGLVLDPATGFPGVRPKSLGQIEAQVRTAKLIGQFALRAGLRHLGDRIDQQPDAAIPTEVESPPAPADESPVASEPTRVRARSKAKPRGDAEPSSGRTETIVVRVLDDLATPEADGLAIVAYDELAASQVVSRLEALTTPELDAVRRYEEAHRHRRTILAKVAQLQAHS